MYYEQEYINLICDKISENPELLFENLGLELEIKNRKVNSGCIIHNGDNNHGLWIDFDKKTWTCFTNHCEQVFKNSLVGFVRGILSNQNLNWRSKGDEIFHFGDVVSYLSGLYNINGYISPSEEEKDNSRFIRQFKSRKNESKIEICSVYDYIKQTGRSDYFLDRGFSQEVLDKYHVRSSICCNRFLSGRSLVPTLDMDGGRILGISGRAEKDGIIPKWLHSKHFPSSTTLYGLWTARDYIKASRKVILVEGPADVWRLSEAGYYNVCGLNGGNLSPAKHVLLDQMGVMQLLLGMDNDEAGHEHAGHIMNNYGDLYNIKTIYPPGKDWADLSINQVKEIVK